MVARNHGITLSSFQMRLHRGRRACEPNFPAHSLLSFRRLTNEEKRGSAADHGTLMMPGTHAI